MEILLLDSAALYQKALPVRNFDSSIHALIADMFAAMNEHDGVGLAAPQVGFLLRLFVLTADDGVQRVFINPHIIASSDEMVEREEGCLSIPGIYANVLRPKKITVQAQDENGKKFVLEADGMLARVIQHENDHLDGILFVDHVDEDTRARIIERFNKREQRKQEKKAQKAAKIRRLSAKIAAKTAKKADKNICLQDN